MDRRARTTSASAGGAVAVLCTASLVAAAPIDEIPYAKWQKLSAVHAVKDDIDRASFEAATAVYPDKGGRLHNVRVGLYLYWRLVNMFKPSARIGGLGLNRLRLVCYPERPLVFKRVRCDMSASLTVVQNGRPQTIAVNVQRLKAGAWFDPSRPDYAPTVHAELKKPLHRILLAVQAQVPGLSIPSEQ